MKITITKADFNKATQDCLGRKALKPKVTNCLVATAIQRTVNPKEVRVGFHTARFRETNDLFKWKHFDIPEDITTVIYDWTNEENDKVLPLLPLTFELIPKD